MHTLSFFCCTILSYTWSKELPNSCSQLLNLYFYLSYTPMLSILFRLHQLKIYQVFNFLSHILIIFYAGKHSISTMPIFDLNRYFFHSLIFSFIFFSLFDWSEGLKEFHLNSKSPSRLLRSSQFYSFLLVNLWVRLSVENFDKECAALSLILIFGSEIQ